MTEKIIIQVDRDLEDLMPLFMDTRKRDMEGLAKGLASNDFAALRVIGHGMKGSGGAFGLLSMSLQPAASASVRCGSPACAVVARIGRLKPSSRKCLTASRPPITGISISIKIASG